VTNAFKESLYSPAVKESRRSCQQSAATRLWVDTSKYEPRYQVNTDTCARILLNRHFINIKVTP